MEVLKVVATNADIAGHYGRFVYAVSVMLNLNL
jgi:hypothetical protein